MTRRRRRTQAAWPAGTRWRTVSSVAGGRASSPPIATPAGAPDCGGATPRGPAPAPRAPRRPGRVVPRSRPFGELGELGAISVPTTVVASGDEADPGHPQALAEAYAAAIPGSELVTDEPGRSPLAWQGSRISDVIAGAVSRAA